MEKNKKNFLLSVFLGLFALSSTVIAEEFALEEVIVTGLREDTRIQETAAAATVFTKDKIADIGISRIEDFFELTPGVNLTQGASHSDTQLSIRGQYNARLTQANYALVIDGVLVPNPLSINQEYIDLEQIEIIRGPQSALFGRNAIAGAVVINTTKPSGTNYSGATQFSYANNNSVVLHQNITVPLTDNFGLKINASANRSDGFYTSRYYNTKSIDQYDDENIALRFQGLAGSFFDDNSGKVYIDFKIGEANVSGGAINFNSLSQRPNFGRQEGGVITPFANAHQDVNNHNYDYVNNVQASNIVQRENASFKLDIDFGNENAITIILSHNNQEGALLGDGTNGTATYLAALGGLNEAQQQAVAGVTAMRANIETQTREGLITRLVDMGQPRAQAEGFLLTETGMAQLSGAIEGAVDTAIRTAVNMGFFANPETRNLSQCYQTAQANQDSIPPSSPYNYGSRTGDTIDSNLINFPLYGASTCDGYLFQRRDQTDTNFEFRYSSNPDQSFAWVAGFAYHEIENEAVSALGQDNNEPIVGLRDLYGMNTNSPTTVYYNDSFSNTVLAGFGSLKFNITDSFYVTVDLRYDQETRSVSNNVPNTVLLDDSTRTLSPDPTRDMGLKTINGIFNPGGLTYYNIIYNFNGGERIADVENEYSAFQPKIALSYRPEGSTSNFYASYSEGFRSGGFNFTGLSRTIDHFYCPQGYELFNSDGRINFLPCNTVISAEGLHVVVNAPEAGAATLDLGPVDAASLELFNVGDQYDSETSTAIEIGVKSSLNNGSINLDFALYQNEIENLQTFNSYAGSFGLLYGISNIDEASVLGVEFSAQFRASEDVSLGFSLSIIESEITQNRTRPYTVGNAVPFVADSNFNFNFQYEGEVADNLKLLYRFDYIYSGTTWFSSVQNNQVNTVFTKNDGACVTAQNLGTYAAALGAYQAALAALPPGTPPSTPPPAIPRLVNCSNTATDYAENADKVTFGQADLSRSKRNPYSVLNMRLELIYDEDFRIGIWGKNILDERYPVEVIVAPEAGVANVLQSGAASYGIEMSLSY